jgi:ATP-dependent Lhr-like helicase
VSLHPADTAPLTLPDIDPESADGEQPRLLLEALATGGAYFFRQLADATGSTDDRALADALWDLVWAGRVSGDTLVPLRSLVGSGRAAHRAARPPALRTRYGRPGRVGGLGRPPMPSRTGPPSVAGRWSLLPARESDPTRRAHASAETLLERHGVLTRGSVVAERTPGGFAAAYRVLSAYEESGRARRGYFVEGLGASQFAVPGAVDRMRSHSGDDNATGSVVVLSSADPANPYGAALPWPVRAGETGGHRPGRKAGALVVLVDGALILYVERGGRSLLTWVDEDAPELAAAVGGLAGAVRDGALGRLTVERADGQGVLDSAFGRALEAAGFHATPKGLRLRG